MEFTVCTILDPHACTMVNTLRISRCVEHNFTMASLPDLIFRLGGHGQNNNCVSVGGKVIIGCGFLGVKY